jgi:hypothetical protein
LARITADPKLALLRSAASLQQRIENQPPHVLERALADRRELRKLARPPEHKEVSLGEMSSDVGESDGDDNESDRFDGDVSRRHNRADAERRRLDDLIEAVGMGIERCRAEGLAERKLIAFQARWVQGLKFKEIRQLPEVGRSVGWIHRSVEEVQERLGAFLAEHFPDLISIDDLRRRPR